MTVRWKAQLLKGQASLKGNNGTEDFANWEGKRFPDQSQIVDGPIPGWKALRLEVMYGDKDPRYSDSRIILDPPSKSRVARVDEGDETWTRWQQMWPENWVGKYPKWDELNSWPNISHSGGSSGEWHHGPLNEDWSNFGGSAPIYMGANDKNLWFTLVDQKTSSVRQSFNMAPLVRGKWYDHVVHAKWSVDPAKGLTEVWIDGVQVVVAQTYNLYPNCYNWWLIGLYRNLHIGDPNLKWPNGTPVYPKGDGEPQQTYVTGMIIGDTKDDVMGAYSVTDTTPPKVDLPAPVVPSSPPTPTNTLSAKAVVGLQQLIAQRQQLETALLQMDAAVVAVTSLRDTAKKILDDTVAILNKGPW